MKYAIHNSLFILLRIIRICQSTGVLDSYPCPSDCRCSQKENQDIVNVVCSVDQQTSLSNFSVIKTSKPSNLHLICNLDAVLKVPNYIFNTLETFVGLRLKDCKISHIPRHFLAGMKSLREIVIENAGELTLDNSMFDHTSKLVHLTIVSSHVTKMPELCKLKELTSLDVTDNNLRSMQDVGIVCAENDTLPNLATVFLNKNSIKSVSLNSFQSTPKLWELRFSDGSLERLDEETFRFVPRLGWLDLSNNSLSEISEVAFESNNNLKVLGLGNNPLSYVPQRTFVSPSKLVLLTLNSAGVNDSVWESLQAMDRLMELQLQGNALTKLDRSAMTGMPNLEFLNLGRNQILSLSKNIFMHQKSLKSLQLNNNNISVLSQDVFSGLSDLSSLSLQENNVSSLHVEALVPLIRLNRLNLSTNQIQTLPKFDRLSKLQILDMSSNRIKDIKPKSFIGLVSLKELYLQNNKLATLTPWMFQSLVALKILQLSSNGIHQIQSGCFDGMVNLTILYLDKNNIHNPKNVFNANLQNLRTVNLSGNKISTTITMSMFSSSKSSIRDLDLSSNQITDITGYAFHDYPNLSTLSLRNNKLTSLDMVDLVISNENDKLPIVYLAGNPFLCDCKLIWLRQKRVREMSGYFLLGDMDKIECSKGYRLRGVTPLYSISVDSMLCSYCSDCQKSTCPCCDFHPCACNFICPAGCECYRKADDLGQHVVLCSGAGITEVPSNIPEMVTDMFIDNNNITEIPTSVFNGLIYLERIYLNNSGIELLFNRSFFGLYQLKYLFLNNNHIKEITFGTFSGLWNLTELHLEYNDISFIEENSFSAMPSLQNLYLSNNKLQSLPDSALLALPTLNILSLTKNPWSCDCEVLSTLLPFFSNISSKLVEYRSMYCLLDTENIKHFNMIIQDRICPNISSEDVRMADVTSRKLSSMFSSYFQTLIIIFGASILMISTILFFVLYNKTFLRTYLRSRCGCRVNCKLKGKKYEACKLYDAFVAYSHKDDDYVIREFIPRLERNNDFKLCIYYRDFPVGGTIEETILSSVQKSNRTILLLSNNFINNEWRNPDYNKSFQSVVRDPNNQLMVVLLNEMKHQQMGKFLKCLVNAKNTLKYWDPYFWKKLLYRMPTCSKRVISTPPDLVLNHTVSRRDEEGYETPVSSSGSREVIQKSPGSQNLSLDSIHNIYEEIGPSTTKLSDRTFV